MTYLSGLHPILSRGEISAAVSRLGRELTRDYADKDPLLIGILKGSFMFMADLVRQLHFPLQVEFVRIASYGQARESSGRPRVVQCLRAPVKDRHLLVIEDIIDTGLTTAFFLEYLHQKKPASLRLCALTDKAPRRRVPVKIDYLGFTVPDKFLVGYGLDCAEQYRHLPAIYAMEEKACAAKPA